MKIVALDIGTVRIGIATSDIMEIIASAYETYRRKNESADVLYIANLVRNLDAGLVVIGLPLKMDGSEGQSVQMAKRFGSLLEKEISVPVCYQDERLSTVSAERVLIESGMRRESVKKKLIALLQHSFCKHILIKRKIWRYSCTKKIEESLLWQMKKN